MPGSTPRTSCHTAGQHADLDRRGGRLDRRASRVTGDGRPGRTGQRRGADHPVIQLAEVVAANKRRFGVSYPWSDASKAVTAGFDFVSRAGEIAAMISCRAKIQ